MTYPQKIIHSFRTLPILRWPTIQCGCFAKSRVLYVNLCGMKKSYSFSEDLYDFLNYGSRYQLAPARGENSEFLLRFGHNVYELCSFFQREPSLFNECAAKLTGPFRFILCKL